MGVFLANALTATTRRNSFFGAGGEGAWKTHGNMENCSAQLTAVSADTKLPVPCLPAIKGTKVRELSLSEMCFYAEGVVVRVCVPVFKYNKSSIWRYKVCK